MLKYFFEIFLVSTLALAAPTRVEVTGTLDRFEVVRRASLPVSAPREPGPRLLDPSSRGVVVEAAAALVVDRESGLVLFEKNADQTRSIASLTKLMSMMIVLENLSATDNPETRDLIFASLVGSDNEAIRSLVEQTGLGEKDFVQKMNARAEHLGMRRTLFVEPTGLDAANQSTARDLIRLLRAAGEIPVIREAAAATIYRTRSGGKIKNTNLLLSSFLGQAPYQIVLGKTGSLEAAGFCLATAIDQGDHGILVVVLGAGDHFSRFTDVKALAYWAFTRWAWTP